MKMYCNKCKKDVTTKNNKCPYCGMNFDLDVVEYIKEEDNRKMNFDLDAVEDIKEENNRKRRKKNIISTIFNWIGVILLIGGFFVALSFASMIDNQEIELIAFLVYAVCYFLVAMFMFAIAEIIQLLYDIRNKLYEKS